MDVIGKGKAFGQKLQDEYTTNDYHKSSDEYDPSTWTMEGAVSELKLLFQVGKRLAFEEKWPVWKEGSEFKAVREAQK